MEQAQDNRTRRRVSRRDSQWTGESTRGGREGGGTDGRENAADVHDRRDPLHLLHLFAPQTFVVLDQIQNDLWRT